MIYQLFDERGNKPLAYCADAKLANFMLGLLKGIQHDSTFYQYVKIKKVYGFIDELKVVKPSSRRSRKKDEGMIK